MRRVERLRRFVCDEEVVVVVVCLSRVHDVGGTALVGRWSGDAAGVADDEDATTDTGSSTGTVSEARRCGRRGGWDHGRYAASRPRTRRGSMDVDTMIRIVAPELILFLLDSNRCHRLIDDLARLLLQVTLPLGPAQLILIGARE